jgi:hypothetical protein
LGILSFRVSDSSVWGIGLGYSGFWLLIWN